MLDVRRGRNATCDGLREQELFERRLRGRRRRILGARPNQSKRLEVRGTRRVCARSDRRSRRGRHEAIGLARARLHPARATPSANRRALLRRASDLPARRRPMHDARRRRHLHRLRRRVRGIFRCMRSSRRRGKRIRRSRERRSRGGLVGRHRMQRSLDDQAIDRSDAKAERRSCESVGEPARCALRPLRSRWHENSTRRVHARSRRRTSHRLERLARKQIRSLRPQQGRGRHRLAVPK
jgi:hypothetical protein